MSDVGECALCYEKRELCCSHVLPAFVFRWQKNTAVGQMRKASEPNRRVQDGWKEPLLCRECEELFQKAEKPFAENVFVPFHKGAVGSGVAYEEWALRFAVSVSWRVLVALHKEASSQKNGLPNFTPYQAGDLRRAELAWREFLLGGVSDPGHHQQHIVFLDLIERSTMGRQSGNLNRYLYRAIEVDLVSNGTVSYVYSKMGRILLIGFINEPHRNEWEGTKIHLKRGAFDFDGARFGVPRWLFEYWNEHANIVGGINDKMSEKQRDVVRRTLTKKRSQYLGSETWLARQVDLGLDPEQGDD